ncbi:type II toxin-antitoxin system RelE/ParE family toxin [Brunnivagina elsteri]|nr:type II toxin-antitoxin system RelE/ParE family toxin [Calothrix elsteri]
MKFFWTETAVENLSAIYTYIAQNSPQYAARIIERTTPKIKTRSQQL